jgi:hypothetical protein
MPSGAMTKDENLVCLLGTQDEHDQWVPGTLRVLRFDSPPFGCLLQQDRQGRWTTRSSGGDGIVLEARDLEGAVREATVKYPLHSARRSREAVRWLDEVLSEPSFHELISRLS